MYYTFLIISLLITLSCSNAVRLNMLSSQDETESKDESKDDELFNSQFNILNLSNNFLDKCSIEYSDSEEEDAPCYDMVFNYTKCNKITCDNKLVLNTVLSDSEISLDKLSSDAKSIWSKAGENNQLTVLCVVLKSAKGRLKKFVFTNQIDYSYYANSASNIISKSHELGYHVVQAQQSHAEGALLQFLQERPNTYKAIVGIGCDKDICPDCKTLLRKTLGEQYKKLFKEDLLNSNPKKSPNYYTPPALRKVLSSKNGIKPCVNSSCNKGNGFHKHEGKVVIKRQVNDKWKYGKGRMKLILLCDKIIERESDNITEEEIASIKKYIQKGCVISDPKDVIIHNNDSISILEYVLQSNKINLVVALLDNWNAGNLSGKRVKEVLELVDDKLKVEYKDNESILKLLNRYF